MLEDFLGSDHFRAGLKNFLVKYSYKNAVTQDLLDELSKACNKKVDITKVKLIPVFRFLNCISFKHFSHPNFHRL